jgi:hypothetical protein
LELCNLPVEVSGHEPLAKEFDAVHLCLCAASTVIPGQLSLQRPTKIFVGPYGFSIFTRRDDGGGTPSDVQRLLLAAQCAEVRDFPVKASQSQQAFDEPGHLPKRQAEQHLHSKTNLDCHVAKLALTAALVRASQHETRSIANRAASTLYGTKASAGSCTS